MSDTSSNTQQHANSKNEMKVLAAYGEVCRTYLAVDDFRAKLLALLPIVSGTGGILLLANKDTFVRYLGPIGVFGVLVTLGLFCYELRGLQRCGKLVDVGLQLEQELQLKHGQFLTGLEDKALGFIGATAAGLIVYLSVVLGWMYVASVGFGAG